MAFLLMMVHNGLLYTPFGAITHIVKRSGLDESADEEYETETVVQGGEIVEKQKSKAPVRVSVSSYPLESFFAVEGILPVDLEGPYIREELLVAGIQGAEMSRAKGASDSCTPTSPGLVKRKLKGAGIAVLSLPRRFMVAIGRRGGGKSAFSATCRARGWAIVPFMEPYTRAKGVTIPMMLWKLSKAFNEGRPACLESARALMKASKGVASMKDALSPEFLDIVTAASMFCSAYKWTMVWLAFPTSSSPDALREYVNQIDGAGSGTLVLDRELERIFPSYASLAMGLANETAVQGAKGVLGLPGLFFSRHEHVESVIPVAIRCPVELADEYEQWLETKEEESA